MSGTRVDIKRTRHGISVTVDGIQASTLTLSVRKLVLGTLPWWEFQAELEPVRAFVEATVQPGPVDLWVHAEEFVAVRWENFFPTSRPVTRRVRPPRRRNLPPLDLPLRVAVDATSMSEVDEILQRIFNSHDRTPVVETIPWPPFLWFIEFAIFFCQPRNLTNA